ncbi:septal ring lytic transglycosylase RlpA family protein [Ideonella sp. YS5]|uniref:septal ring lytic transglycosylase RlpA family protein n=1 Tax=Ideonella sp. YS5 TaxID=3453714 RepID=UPI003EECA808
MGALLAGCSTPRGPAAGADGGPPPGTEVPDLRQLPDAELKVEPIRSGGPNKPYEVLGQTYTPMTKDEPLVQRGLASWYGRKFHGRRTASGETYNMYAMTAAHKTMPIPSYARVRNPANGREVIVRVNDRGPFSSGRVIDLSYAAAVKLGVQNGVSPVEVERITYEDIRTGAATLRGANVAVRAPAPAAAAPEAGSTPDALPDAVAAVPAETGVVLPAPAMTSSKPPPGAVADKAMASDPSPVVKAATPAATGFWLQLGAFGQGAGAYSFQQRLSQDLDWLSPLLTVFAENGLFRLQAGPYASREQAREAAEKVRSALALVPMIVERR